MVSVKDLRHSLWSLYTDDPFAYSNPCFCCRSKQITAMDCVVGHVVAKANDGPKNVSNTRPICASCNNAMGTRNLLDYRRETHKSYVCYSQNCKQEAICGWFCDKHVDTMSDFKSIFTDLNKAQASREVWNGRKKHTNDNVDRVIPLSSSTSSSSRQVVKDDDVDAIADHHKLIETIDGGARFVTGVLWTKLFLRADYGKKGNPLAFVKSRINRFDFAFSVVEGEGAPVKKSVNNLKEAYVFYPDLRACGPIDKLINVFRQVGIFNLPIGKKYEMVQQAGQRLKKSIVTHSDKTGRIDITVSSNDVIECLYNNCFDPYAIAVNGSSFSSNYVFGKDGSEYGEVIRAYQLQSVTDDINGFVTRYGKYPNLVDIDRPCVTVKDFPDEIRINVSDHREAVDMKQQGCLQQVCGLLTTTYRSNITIKDGVELLVRLGYSHSVGSDCKEIVFTRPVDILSRVTVFESSGNVAPNIKHEDIDKGDLDATERKPPVFSRIPANQATCVKNVATLPRRLAKDVTKSAIDGLTDILENTKIVDEVASDKNLYREKVIQVWVSEDPNGRDKTDQCLELLREMSLDAIKQLQSRKVCQNLMTVFGGDQIPELEYILFARLGGRLSAAKSEVDAIMTRVNNLINRNPDELLYHVLDWVKSHHNKITYNEMLAFLELL